MGAREIKAHHGTCPPPACYREVGNVYNEELGAAFVTMGTE